MTQRRAEIPALTGFRFYAALLVVVTHFCNTHLAAAGYAWSENMTVFGSIGMSMFFVLSGFVIHYNYGDDVARRRRGEIYRFAVARFARLYPLFIFATAISIATAPAMQSYQWSALPYWLTMTHGWLPISIGGRFPGDAMTPGSWSVSVEVLLYIMFIPLAMIMRSQLRSQRDILSVALIAGLGLFIFHGARAITGIGAAPSWLWY
ncbi:MAG: acyltransferase [Proteobacteria bacterium]|nr:acyltransferase [Pseudomonadota bacterium]